MKASRDTEVTLLFSYALVFMFLFERERRREREEREVFCALAYFPKATAACARPARRLGSLDSTQASHVGGREPISEPSDVHLRMNISRKLTSKGEMEL